MPKTRDERTLEAHQLFFTLMGNPHRRDNPPTIDELKGNAFNCSGSAIQHLRDAEAAIRLALLTLWQHEGDPALGRDANAGLSKIIQTLKDAESGLPKIQRDAHAFLQTWRCLLETKADEAVA